MMIRQLSRANLPVRAVSRQLPLQYAHSIPALRQYATKTADSQDSPPKAAPKVSIGTRISNAFSFAFYSGLVLGGVGLTGLVIYYFVSDVLLPTSDVQVFQRAFAIVERDEKCQELLGGGRIKAHGENTEGKWNRNRPIASRRGVDAHGREHLLMHFHVKGALAEGIVRLEMIKSDQKSSTGIGTYDFRYLVLEVPGQPRVHVIDNSSQARPKDPSTGFLGVKWGPKS